VQLAQSLNYPSPIQGLSRPFQGWRIAHGLDDDEDIENLRDPTLRKLLQLEELPVQIVARHDHDEGEKLCADGCFSFPSAHNFLLHPGFLENGLMKGERAKTQ
jgi:hypothetical protein